MRLDVNRNGYKGLSYRRRLRAFAKSSANLLFQQLLRLRVFANNLALSQIALVTIKPNHVGDNKACVPRVHSHRVSSIAADLMRNQSVKKWATRQ